MVSYSFWVKRHEIQIFNIINATLCMFIVAANCISDAIW